MQAFVRALAQQRPEDHVTFTPLKDLPAPSRLPSSTRLILLDLPGLDWRLQDLQGPPTLVMRISRLQAHQRLGQARAGARSACCGVTRRWSANCA